MCDRKEGTMTKPKYGYGWALKFTLAAILLGIGIYMFFADDIVYTITGVVIVIFSVLRVVPLMRSLNKETLRTINLIEIIFDFLIGAVMVWIALSKGSVLASEPLWGLVYRFGLAFVFYVRGLVYLVSVVFFGEKSEIPKFWIHIGALTLGTAIAVLENFDYGTVGVFFLVVSLIGSGYLSYDGFKGYKTYRTYQKELNKGKEKTDDVGDTIRIPEGIEEEKKERPYVS
jgi:hypothetical protein